MKIFDKAKLLHATVTTAVVLVMSGSAAFGASDTSGVSSPVPFSTTAKIGDVIDKVMNFAVFAITTIAGVWFLFHLYKAIMIYTLHSKQAQMREEAKSHLIHVAVSGVLVGGAVVLASALYNFGSTL